MQARWNGAVIAEAADVDILTIEGNPYFPPSAIRAEYLAPSGRHTMCSWKGEASYYDVVVDGKRNPTAAWYYPVPKGGSIPVAGGDFTNYVAFWNGVEVS